MANILPTQKMMEIKPFSNNNLKIMGRLIEEVEFSKIQKLLGRDVFKKIKQEVDSGNISAELNEICEEGLWKAITYFTYARYIQESSLIDTFTGVVQKQRQDSKQAPYGQIKNIVNEYTDMAITSYKIVKCKIEKKYGSCRETVETGFWEVIGIRRGKEENGQSYTTKYWK